MEIASFSCTRAVGRDAAVVATLRVLTYTIDGFDCFNKMLGSSVPVATLVGIKVWFMNLLKW